MSQINNSKIAPVLLAGTLSMFFAEVFSGASVLWFIDLWALLVTFPLYLAHLMFFFNIAIKFRKLDFTSLYLLGVLFGLYESWITKVIWAGYFNQEPMFGTFLGFAVGELFIITFFWHPIFSFIVPILVFECLSLPDKSDKEIENIVIPEHISIVTKSRKNWIASIFIVLIGASFLSLNSSYNIIVAETTILGSLAILLLFYRLCKRKLGSNFSIYSLQLEKKGFTMITGYLILLYIVTFFFLLPERVPSLLTIGLTIVLYMAVILLFYIYKPEKRKMFFDENMIYRIFSLKDLITLAIIFIFVTTILCIVPSIGLVAALAFNISILASGIILIGFTVLKVLKNIL